MQYLEYRYRPDVPCVQVYAGRGRERRLVETYAPTVQFTCGPVFDLDGYSMHALTCDNEPIGICAVCESGNISEVGNWDESWTVCGDCQSIEQGYLYVSVEEYENEGYG